MKLFRLSVLSLFLGLALSSAFRLYVVQDSETHFLTLLHIKGLQAAEAGIQQCFFDIPMDDEWLELKLERCQAMGIKRFMHPRQFQPKNSLN